MCVVTLCSSDFKREWTKYVQTDDALNGSASTRLEGVECFVEELITKDHF